MISERLAALDASIHAVPAEDDEYAELVLENERGSRPFSVAGAEAAKSLMAARLAIRLARLPEIAEMTLAQLHQSQIGWKFTQSASFEAYLKRKNDSLPEEERQPHQTIARDWPMVPHV